MKTPETTEETKHRIAARNTPAGRLLWRMGYDYWDTESAARRVAEHAAGEIKELTEALSACHSAIDTLFAQRIANDPDFYPSRSGAPWDAIVQASKALQKHLP